MAILNLRVIRVLAGENLHQVQTTPKTKPSAMIKASENNKTCFKESQSCATAKLTTVTINSKRQ